ncbi:hypothetical protein [Streptomyces longispororuber]|uniref:hypothetical protein n=1 Tax=Streptomyces longispororuber TaxID=68230 RepID=UPI003701026A
MNAARPRALTVPLAASELAQVQRAAEAAGQSVDDFVRAAVLEAATDPLRDALEQAVATVRARGDRIQHEYAR